MGRIAPDLAVQDAVVPRSALPDVLDQVAAIARRYDLQVANVFHAGDGNLHPNISFDGRDPDVVGRVRAANHDIMHACLAVGGSITGEHGVGSDKLEYMPDAFDADTLGAMRAVRRVFDPFLPRQPRQGRPEPRLPRMAPGSGGMNPGVLDRLRALLGAAAVSRDPDGVPRAVPDSVDALAATLRLVDEAGWRVRLEGHGSWVPPDARADLALTTRGLDRIVAVHPADLVATVEGGVPMDALQRRLAADGMWLALDPPGRPERTIGSVVATATAGALRTGFGPVRDHVLGCTAVTGDGRVIRPGGTVVKNVAGYDLTKLQVGGFGAFGVLTTLHLRLRARPGADLTLARARAARSPDQRRARPLGGRRRRSRRSSSSRRRWRPKPTGSSRPAAPARRPAWPVTVPGCWPRPSCRGPNWIPIGPTPSGTW